MEGRSVVVQTGQGSDKNEVGLLDLLAVFVRRWRVIAASLAAAIGIGTAALLLQPKWYVAQILVVPSTGSSASPAQLLAGQLSAGLITPLSIGGNGEKLIGAIIGSRTLSDSIARRIAHDSTAADEIRTVVDKHTESKTNDDGSMSVTIQDRDPERAAKIANSFPIIINRIAAQLSAEAAMRKQEFLRRELDDARERLNASERQLTGFQRKEELPQVQEQAERSLDVAATLQQRIMEQEMRIAQLARTSTHDNPELQSARAQLATLQDQLRQMTSGSAGNSSVLISLSSSPDLKAASARLLRQYTQDEQVYNSLMASYIQAQLDAQSDLPVLSVLDPAMVPTVPDHSRRLIIAVLSVFLGLAVGLVSAIVREYLQRARSDPDNAGFFLALADFRRDMSRLLPGRTRTQD